MKKAKRLTAVILCALMAVSAFSAVPVSAATVGNETTAVSTNDILTSGDFEFSVFYDGTLELARYYGDDTVLVIPDTIYGKAVTSIGYGAFWGCTSLSSITIPDSVTSIGDCAFYDCTGLTSITIPDSVTSIGDCAFGGCTNLKYITVDENNDNYSSLDGVLFDKNKDKLILCPAEKKGDYFIPDSVTSIGEHAFSDCTSLTSITIPNSVTSIGNWAFGDCTSLSSITIPDSVTSIGYGAFCGCASLTSINIPDSVTSIGEHAFSDCTSLTSITIPDSVTSIGDCAFEDCTGLTSITIPDSVTSIGYYSFAKCTSLTSITIPDSITIIGKGAFSGCKNLKDITVDENNENYSSLDGVLFDKNKYTLISYPQGKEEDYSIPDSITSIGDNAFRNCTGLTSITIPDSVTSIGEGAFSNCTGLTSITIPDSVTSIGNWTFFGCTNLSSITIPDSITVIRYAAFYGCKSLSSITIPDSVTSIGEDALGYFYNEYSESREKIENFTIYGYKNTAAETYANEKGFAFVEVSDEIAAGDADGNGIVNVNDVTCLQMHLAGTKNSDGSDFIDTDNKVIFDSIDMNKDGKLDVLDVTALQFNIAGNN